MMVRRHIGNLFLAIAGMLSASSLGAQTIKDHPVPAYHPAPFVHPGLLHRESDLQRMKKMVADSAEPWKSGFYQLASHPHSNATWKERPQEHVERSLLAGYNKGIDQLEADANACYQNALMWCVTGNEAHARKAIEILDAWSDTLKVFDGTDVELGAGENAADGRAGKRAGQVDAAGRAGGVDPSS